MRSLGFTLILALLALLAGGVAAWQWTQGNFDSLLGAPPQQVGQRIYSDFTPDDVRYIEVSTNGVKAAFEWRENAWQGIAPWQDRLDPRAAVSIVNFTLGLHVEDVAEMDEVDAQQAGLKETGINVRLENGSHELLAKYKIGRRTPWLAPGETVFVRPLDPNHKHHIYICTGYITEIFQDGLKHLRDHHPFYFNPLALEEIRIDSDEGALTLARETPKSAWHIVKPLDLATDKPAMIRLLEGLYRFEAVALSDRAATTLPASGPVGKSRQIAIKAFGAESETVLEIFPPDSPDAATAKAAVSDRPGTVFELPLKPSPGTVSLADLPLAVNDLRDATLLTDAERKSLRGILILPSTGPEILISRVPKQPWMTTIAGVTQEANEERLFALLKAVTGSRAIGFETDAATDFVPWGLENPFLILRFLAADNTAFELRFGMDAKGGYFVNRTGTATVMRIDPALISSIPVRTYEWRQARLWSIDRFNLMQIDIGPGPPLELRYVFNPEGWKATRDGVDLTSKISPAKANYLLANLEGLKATRWLDPDDASASKALLAPSLTFRIVEKGTDELGDFSGLIVHSVSFAPATTQREPLFYYGRLGTDENPFLLDRDLYKKLAADVMEKDAD